MRMDLPKYCLLSRRIQYNENRSKATLERKMNVIIVIVSEEVRATKLDMRRSVAKRTVVVSRAVLPRQQTGRDCPGARMLQPLDPCCRGKLKLRPVQTLIQEECGNPRQN